MFIQTTLFAKPSVQMKDENRKNGSLKLACTVCEADNNNPVCCLLEPVLQGALVTEERCTERIRNVFHLNVISAGLGIQVTELYC